MCTAQQSSQAAFLLAQRRNFGRQPPQMRRIKGMCMEPLSVVLFQTDAKTAQILAENLSQHVRSVHLARTCDEIRPSIAGHRAEVLVLDLENSCLNEVERLHREFPGLCIVCTHRLADEELWTEALSQGATDMCEPRNTEDIVRSVMRKRPHGAAA
jgi:DNA-binding NtrC family response regulator